MPLDVALGKQDHKPDDRTMMMAKYLSPSVVYPHTYDLDNARRPFPVEMWGNDKWGDCVKVAQANQILRLERIEQRRTMKISTADVVNEYKKQTGAKLPSDENDTGLVMLDNNKLWRSQGFHHARPHTAARSYTIAMFGELEPNDRSALRAACFLLHGLQFGFSLPLSAQQMTENRMWNFNPAANKGAFWKAGSWGGHAVFSKSYNNHGFEVLTWGKKVFVTNSFIEKYCDEVWVIVDSANKWAKRPEINVSGMIEHLRNIGASNIQ
jgi:hypothetical protein